MATRPIPFVIGDAQTPADELALSASSDNRVLVPDASIVFGGAGSNRTVVVTPAGLLKGTATITVTVRNANNRTASSSFGLTVADFTQISTSLVGVSGGSAAWGDYDNDGDLDILLNGLEPSGTAVTRVYRNDGAGVFTRVDVDGAELVRGGAIWGDYDNDGDLDIAVSGNTTNHVLYWKIYRNDGADAFACIATLYESAFSGTDSRLVSLAWADSDNDGDLDPLFAGWPASALFRNNRDDTFTNTGLTLPSGHASSVAWADYDNDGDQDFVMTEGYPMITRVFRNDGNGNFTMFATALPGINLSSVAWGDIDNDGDLDIAMTGYNTNVVQMTYILRNLGNGTFSDTMASVPGATFGSVAWGDFDNDGDLDLLLGLYTGTRIYRNDGNGFFNDSGIYLPSLDDGNAAWGDYDGDGDLDILLCGYDWTYARSAKVFRNDGASPNFPPDPPSNLSAATAGNSVTMTWSSATDRNQTGGLSYNVRLGTTPGGSDVWGAMADPITGYRRLPALGNAGQRLSWTITNLKAGTYYWSVQAIDHAFAGSAFAPEQSFTIWPPLITNQPQSQTIFAGQTATFSVGATGTEPLAYQWRFNSTNIAGATNATLVLSNAQFPDQGWYSVVVSDIVGTAVSSNAFLTVNSAPVVTSPPRGHTVALGSEVTFTVDVIGTTPLFFQWYFNGVEIPDATNASLVLPNVQFTNVGNYSVRVTNWVGATFSPNAQLNIYSVGQGVQTIPAAGAKDMVYDSARDVVYIASGSSVLR